jgi:hypothetical protein
MRKIRDVLRLSAAGMSKRQIAARVSKSIRAGKVGLGGMVGLFASIRVQGTADGGKGLTHLARLAGDASLPTPSLSPFTVDVPYNVPEQTHAQHNADEGSDAEATGDHPTPLRVFLRATPFFSSSELLVTAMLLAGMTSMTVMPGLNSRCPPDYQSENVENQKSDLDWCWGISGLC